MDRFARTVGEQEADWLLWCAVWRWYWEWRRSIGQGAPVRETQSHGVDIVIDDATAQGVLQPDEAAFLRHWVRIDALKAGLRRAKLLAARLEREEREILAEEAGTGTAGTTTIRLAGGATVSLTDWVDDCVYETVQVRRASRPTVPDGRRQDRPAVRSMPQRPGHGGRHNRHFGRRGRR